MERVRLRPKLMPEELEPQPAPKTKRTPKPKPKRSVDFAFILDAVLQCPPIRHRDQSGDVGFSVLEFAIGITAVALARLDYTRRRHEHGLRAGKIKIDATRKRGVDPDYTTWVDGRRIKRKGLYPASHYFREAGAAGYEDGRSDFDRANYDKFTLTVTGSALLSEAGLDRNGKNLAQVPTALARLCKPAGKFAAILEGWQKETNGRFRLVINGWWIPKSDFERVPMPLPTGGSIVLVMFLYCVGAESRAEGRINVPIKVLCKKLGVPSLTKRRRDRVVELVNEHCERIGKGTRFQIVDVGNGANVRVQTVRLKQAPTEDELADEAEDEVPTDNVVDEDDETDAAESKRREQEECERSSVSRLRSKTS